MSTKHEGLSAAYRAFREFYNRNGSPCEDRKRLIKRNFSLRRLNKLLDLGAKL